MNNNKNNKERFQFKYLGKLVSYIPARIRTVGRSLKSGKIIFFFFFILLPTFLISVLGNKNLSDRPAKASSASQSLDPQVKNAPIDREFLFPVKNSAGEEVTKVSYVLESADLKDEIIIRGQRARSVPGKLFLIINLKLRNDSREPAVINTRDYIRISNNDGKDWLAADIHNNSVEIQPISTKLTRLGFPVGSKERSFKVQIGEILGAKTIHDLNFKCSP